MSLRHLAPLVTVAAVLVGCTATSPTSSAIAPADSPATTNVVQVTPPAVASLTVSAATVTPIVSQPPPTSAAPSATGSPIATLTPSTAVGPTSIPSSGQLPGALDPCTLLTDAQASAVNSVSYGPGEMHQMTSPAVECVWQSSAPSASVVVQVAFLPNVSDAQLAYEESIAAQKFAITDVPNFADKAVIARAASASTGGIYVREGTAIFDVVYLNGTAPTDDLLKFTAELVLGKLPPS